MDEQNPLSKWSSNDFQDRLGVKWHLLTAVYSVVWLKKENNGTSYYLVQPSRIWRAYDKPYGIDRIMQINQQQVLRSSQLMLLET